MLHHAGQDPGGEQALAASVGQEPLVTVVIPAYNAEDTIEETLRSVRAQSHRALEILVVDDGSRDRTPEIVADHARADPRVRLIMQQNGGVAAARNRGIAEARGEFVAPVDADDLWRPDKILLQLEVMRAGGPRMGLVYTQFEVIDGDSRVIARMPDDCREGDVFLALCERNMVGNGSSALIRRSVLEEVGGYDPTLRARGGQGCEDIKLYLQIAERYTFGLVRQPLTGYRRLADSMSSDGEQMIRSLSLVADEFCARRPELRVNFDRAYSQVYPWLFRRSLASRRIRSSLHLARQMATHDPVTALKTFGGVPAMVAGLAMRKLRSAAVDSAPAGRFLEQE